MNNNFCERFILNYNSNLTHDDIVLLDILSEKYDILTYKHEILHHSMPEILSRTIIDSIPHKYAQLNVLDDVPRVVVRSIKKDEPIKPLYPINGCHVPGEEYIDKEIERMNTFIKLKLMDNER